MRLKLPFGRKTPKPSAGNPPRGGGHPSASQSATPTFRQMWRQGLGLGVLFALAFALTSTMPTQAQGVLPGCGVNEVHCRVSGGFSAVSLPNAVPLPGLTSPTTPAFGDLAIEDFAILETKGREYLSRALQMRESMSPYRQEVGFDEFLRSMDPLNGFSVEYTGDSPYNQPTFGQDILAAEGDLAKARSIYAFLAVFAPEDVFRSRAPYSTSLCTQPEDPNPPAGGDEGYVADAIIDWCDFRARLRQSVREAANIRLILGQEFMIDALATTYGAELAGVGDQLVRKEINQLRAAQNQFMLGEMFFMQGLSLAVGNGCYVSDFYTETEWSLLARTADSLSNIHYLIGSRMSYLGVTNAATADQAQASSISLLRKGANEGYVKMIGLTGIATANKSRCTVGEEPDGDAVADMVTRMIDAQRQAQNMARGLNVFGFDVMLTPTSAYKSSQPLNCDTNALATRGLWDVARCAANTAKALQLELAAAERAFEQSQETLRDEVKLLREGLDERIDNVLGCGSTDVTDEEFRECAETQIEFAFECLELVDTPAVTPPIPQPPFKDDFDLCMGQEGFFTDNDTNTALNDLRQTYVEYLGIQATAQNMLRRIQISTDANKTVTDWIIGAGTATTAAEVAEAGLEGLTCLDVDDPVGAAFTIAACGTATAINAAAKAAAGAVSTTADVKIANAENEAEISNMMLDLSELMIAVKSAEQAYLSKKSDVTGIFTAMQRDVAEASRRRRYFESSPANDPSFRMTRDVKRLELAEALETAAKYAYLAARRAEYEYAASLSSQNFAISDIYRARTAQDIINYLEALRTLTDQTLAGAASQDLRVQDLPTISVVRDILFLDDASLLARGTLPENLERVRANLFSIWVADHTVVGPDNFDRLVFTMTTSLVDDGIFARLSPNAYDQQWRMMMSGINLPQPGGTGLRVNLVTPQEDLGYRTVSVTQNGLVHLRSFAGCIFDYRLIQPSILLGLQWPDNQDPREAFSNFNASVNTPTFSTTPGYMAGEFYTRAVSATEWRITVFTRAPESGLEVMNLERLTDIEFKVNAMFTSRQPGNPNPADCARLDY